MTGTKGQEESSVHSTKNFAGTNKFNGTSTLNYIILVCKCTLYKIKSVCFGIGWYSPQKKKKKSFIVPNLMIHFLEMKIQFCNGSTSFGASMNLIRCPQMDSSTVFCDIVTLFASNCMCAKIVFHADISFHFIYINQISNFLLACHFLPSYVLSLKFTAMWKCFTFMCKQVFNI